MDEKPQFKLVQFRTARITEEHEPITKNTLASYTPTCLILCDEKRIPFRDDLKFFPQKKEGAVFVFDPRDLSVSAPKKAAIQKALAVSPLTSDHDDWQSYAIDLKRDLENMTNFNSLNFNVIVASEFEIEILMKGYRQLLVYLESELREIETQVIHLAEGLKDAKEQAHILTRLWKVLEETKVHPALADNQSTLADFAHPKGKTYLERKKNNFLDTIADMDQPLTLLLQEIPKLKDNFAALKGDMAVHLEDYGNRKAAHALKDELEKIKSSLVDSDRESVVAFSQTQIPRATQIYEAITAKTKATLEQRENFLGWLNQNMAAVGRIFPLLDRLRVSKEEIHPLAVKLKELFNQLASQRDGEWHFVGIENTLRGYGFCLTEKIFRSKSRDILLSIQEQCTTLLKGLTPDEENRRSSLKKIFGIFPRLSQGSPPVFSLRLQDTDEADPVNIEEKDVTHFCSVLTSHGLPNIAASIETYFMETQKKSPVKFELDYISSTALQDAVKALMMEKKLLQESLDNRSASTPPEKRIKELEEHLRKLFLENSHLKQQMAHQVSSPTTSQSPELLEQNAALQKQNDNLQKENQALRAKLEELQSLQSLVGSTSQFSDGFNSASTSVASSYVQPLHGIDWNQKYHALELEAQEQQRVFEAKIKEISEREQQAAKGLKEALEREQQAAKTHREAAAREAQLARQVKDLTEKEAQASKSLVDMAQRLQRAEFDANTKLDGMRKELAEKEEELRRARDDMVSMVSQSQIKEAIVGEEAKKQNHVHGQQTRELERTRADLEATRKEMANYEKESTRLHQEIVQLKKVIEQADKVFHQVFENIFFVHESLIALGRHLGAHNPGVSLPEALTQDFFDRHFLEQKPAGMQKNVQDLLYYNQEHLVRAIQFLENQIVDLVRENKVKLSVEDFQVGDRALFVHTRDMYLAFSQNRNGPQYEMDQEEHELIPGCRYIIGKIVSIEPNDDKLTSFRVYAEDLIQIK